MNIFPDIIIQSSSSKGDLYSIKMAMTTEPSWVAILFTEWLLHVWHHVRPVDTDYWGHTYYGWAATYLRPPDGHRHPKTDTLPFWWPGTKQVFIIILVWGGGGRGGNVHTVYIYVCVRINKFWSLFDFWKSKLFLSWSVKFLNMPYKNMYSILLYMHCIFCTLIHFKKIDN